MASFFQVAYVCRDLEVAMRGFAGGDWDTAFLVLDVAVQLEVLDAPVRRIGLAFAGEINIELIEPAPGVPSIYSDHLRDGPAPVFHNHRYLVESEDQWAACTWQAGADAKVVMEGEVPDLLRYRFIDRRQDPGHYLELVQLFDAGRALFASVPRNQLKLALAGGEGR